MEGARGAGMFFVGYGEGNYEAKASITLFKEEVDMLQSALPKGASLSSIPAFNIVVEYDRDLTKVRDVIQYCSILHRCTFVTGNQSRVIRLVPISLTYLLPVGFFGMCRPLAPKGG